MRGCDSCSALLYVDDVFCPTCGAGVEEAQTAAGKVRIPMRRHGVIPAMPDFGEVPADADGRPGRGLLAGLLASLAVSAAAAAGAVYRFW
jgi:hypothetical protein